MATENFVQNPKIDNLVFINATDLSGAKPKDAERRTLIRKRVMRDIGKARRRAPPQSEKLDLELIMPGVLPDHDTTSDTTVRSCSSGSTDAAHRKAIGYKYPDEPPDWRLCSWTRGVYETWNQVFDAISRPAFTDYGNHLVTDSDSMLEQICYYSSSRGLGLYKDAWYPLACLDDVARYQVLSLLKSYLQFCTAQSGDASHTEALKYYAAATKAINARMNEPHLRLSDGTVAAVVAAVCQAHLRSDFRLWGLHMKGLKTLIELRGGVDSLASNQLLRILLFFVDTIGACAQDIRPCFPLPVEMVAQVSNLHLTTTRPPLAREISDAWQSVMPQSSLLNAIFEDVCVIITHLKHQSRDIFWSNPVYVGNLVHNLIHRLNAERPERNTGVEECVRTAGCLALAEIRRTLGIIPISVERCTRKMMRLLQANAHEWRGLEVLKLWVMVVTTTQSNSNEEREWFLGETLGMLEQCHPERRAQLVDGLEQILWPSFVVGAVMSVLRGQHTVATVRDIGLEHALM